MKYKFYIALLILLFSCGEYGETIYVDRNYNLTTPFFRITQIYPEYTFWNHEFYVELDFDDIKDSNNVKFFINNVNLKVSQKTISDTKIKYCLITPFNSKSDMIQIRYYENNDSGAVYTSKLKVINSEIKIDSVTFKKSNEFEVHGSGFEYYQFLRAMFDNEIYYDFKLKSPYQNRVNDSIGPIGNKISNNLIRFTNPEMLNFGLKIQAREELSKINQVHSYDYIYKSKSDNFKLKIVDYKIENDSLKIYFKNLFKSNEITSVYLNNTKIQHSNIKTYSFDTKNDKLIEDYGLVSIQLLNPNNYNKVDLNFRNHASESIILNAKINNNYSKALFSTMGIIFTFQANNLDQEFISNLTKFQENKRELNSFDKNNFSYASENEKDNLELINLDDINIYFKYYNEKYFYQNEDIITVFTSVEYSGNYLKDYTENKWNVFMGYGNVRSSRINRKIEIKHYSNGTLDSISIINPNRIDFDSFSNYKLTFVE